MDDPEAEESIESFQPSSTPEVDEGAERRGSLSKPSPRAEDLDEDQSDQNMEGRKRNLMSRKMWHSELSLRINSKVAVPRPLVRGLPKAFKLGSENFAQNPIPERKGKKMARRVY